MYTNIGAYFETIALIPKNMDVLEVWVSFPEYGSRVVLWQRFMED